MRQWYMIATILAACVAFQGSSTPIQDLSPNDLIQLLQNEGYSIGNKIGGLNFEISRKGTNIIGCVRSIPDWSAPGSLKTGSNLPKPVIVHFETQYAVQRKLDVTAPYRLESACNPYVTTTLQNHLQNYISARATFNFKTQMTARDLIESLNLVWDKIDQDGKQPDGKFTSITNLVPKLSSNVDDRLLAVADEVSMLSLGSYWGWQSNRWYVSHNGWVLTMKVDGYECELSDPLNSWGTPSSKLSLSVILDQVSPVQSAWLNNNQARYTWAKISPLIDSKERHLGTTLQLDKTTKVRDVKQKIQAFVDQVKQLDKEMRK